MIKIIGNSSPLERWQDFAAAGKKQKYATFFSKNGIPSLEGWFFVGEVTLGTIWGLLILSFLSFFCFSLIGLIVGNVWGILIVGILLLAMFSFCLYFYGFIILVLVAIFCPFISVPIWLLSKIEERGTYWTMLFLWSIFCFSFCIYFGAADEKRIFTNDNSDPMLIAPTTWIDWINPVYNHLILFFGYPILLFIGFGGLVFQISYHKYKPVGNKNWSAEGLDSHLLDGDADN